MPLSKFLQMPGPPSHIPLVMIGKIALLSGLLLSTPAIAAQATVAVAANFLTTAEQLAERYEAASGHEIILAHGSTGRLYAQIVNGAPFDMFLSADTERPDRLEGEDRVAERRAYAIGRLVLVSRTEVDDLARELERNRIALADPAVAPFGAAALEVLSSLDLDPQTLDIVSPDSVGQVAAFFETGNVALAFVASSQLPYLSAPVFEVPVEALHTPIRQDAVLLARAVDNEAAKGFFAFLAAPEALRIIADAGYGVPE